MKYISGSMIKDLREKKKMTQIEVAEYLQVSDKTISKWENERGLPDISLLSPLATVLGVTVTELLAGDYAINKNKSGNMKKTVFYVCPICGNIIHALGEGDFNCCGIKLMLLESEKEDEQHLIVCETIDNEYCLTMEHEMGKNHYISFIAYVTSDKLEIIKLYPEQNICCRFRKNGHGLIFAYCNKHGLFQVRI
ncbi:MAG: helix-turn-helix domain-containing protein [Lachnospiraceae bacterium]